MLCWFEEAKRRETWEETVDRYINFLNKSVALRLSCLNYLMNVNNTF